MSDKNQKLQRLLAQQRAIAAQIKSIEDRERERQERAILLIVRRHKLDRFDPEDLDQALALAVAELEANAAREPTQPQTEGMGVTHGG